MIELRVVSLPAATSRLNAICCSRSVTGRSEVARARREEVVGRAPRASRPAAAGPVLEHLGRGLLGAGRDLARVAVVVVEGGVGPLEEQVAVGLGHAEQQGDGLERQLGGDVDEEVARAAAHHGVEDLVAAGGEVGFDLAEPPRADRRGDDPADVLVAGVVLHVEEHAGGEARRGGPRSASRRRRDRRRCPTRTSPRPGRPTARRRGGSGTRSPRRRACAAVGSCQNTGASARSRSNTSSGAPPANVSRSVRSMPARSTSGAAPVPMAPSNHRMRTVVAVGDEHPRDGVELYWIPLGVGAGGALVRWSGRIYEALVATMRRRPRQDLYHSRAGGPPRRGHHGDRDGACVADPRRARRGRRGRRREPAARPVAAVPLRGALLARRVDPRRRRRSRRTGAGERRPATGRGLVARVASFPTCTWGRDELGAGDMWNSNSLASWLLAGAGVDLTSIGPPAGGRAPGWDAGIAVAARSR